MSLFTVCTPTETVLVSQDFEDCYDMDLSLKTQVCYDLNLVSQDWYDLVSQVTGYSTLL